MSIDAGREDVLRANLVDGRRRELPLGIDPVFADKDLVLVPVVDFRRVHGNNGVALDGAGDDAPRLTGMDNEVVGWVVVAAGDAVFLDVRVADGVMVID